MKLTKEQFNIIAEYETDFSHALNEGYFRIANRNLLKNYSEIYLAVFGKNSKILNGCNRCILSDIKELAKVYFNDKKEMEIEAQKKAVEEPIEEPDTDMPKMSKYTYGEKKKTSTKKNNKK